MTEKRTFGQVDAKGVGGLVINRPGRLNAVDRALDHGDD